MVRKLQPLTQSVSQFTSVSLRHPLNTPCSGYSTISSTDCCENRWVHYTLPWEQICSPFPPKWETLTSSCTELFSSHGCCSSVSVLRVVSHLFMILSAMNLIVNLVFFVLSHPVARHASQSPANTVSIYLTDLSLGSFVSITYFGWLSYYFHIFGHSGCFISAKRLAEYDLPSKEHQTHKVIAWLAS